MADPYYGEIRIFPFNFAPANWAFCNGQLIPISQNTALFSILGTNFGGNGQTTFALPNLQDRAPLHPGQGTGLTQRFVGESSGQSTVTLAQQQIPAHTHQAFCNVADGGLTSPVNNAWALTDEILVYKSGAAPDVQMNANALSTAGSSQPHNNMPPFLTLNFCICMNGIFPAREDQPPA